jgi:hypothetical protein
MKLFRDNTDIRNIVIYHTGTMQDDVGLVLNRRAVLNGKFGSDYDLIIGRNGQLDFGPYWIFAVSPLQYEEAMSIARIGGFQRHRFSAATTDDVINQSSIHIALIGDFDLQFPTAQQRTVLKDVLAYLQQHYDIITIYYASDVMQTSSPGLNFFSKGSLGIRDITVESVALPQFELLTPVSFKFVTTPISIQKPGGMLYIAPPAPPGPPPPPPVPTEATVVYAINKFWPNVGPLAGAEHMVLTAVDVSNKSNPFWISDTLVPEVDPNYMMGPVYPYAGLKNLFVDNKYMYYYCANPPGGGGGILMVRTADPNTPSIVCSSSVPGAVNGILRYKGSKLVLSYLGNTWRNPGIAVFDISNVPTLSSVFSSSEFSSNDVKAGSFQPLAYAGGSILIPTTSSKGFDQLSAFDPSFGTWSFHPISATEQDLDWSWIYGGLAVKGNYIYKVISNYPVSNFVVEILDWTNNFVEIIPGGGRISPPNFAGSVQGTGRLYIFGNYLLVFGDIAIGRNSLWVYDISDPTNPALANSYHLGEYASMFYEVCSDGKYLYVFSSDEGAVAHFDRQMQIYSLTNLPNVTLVSTILLEPPLTLNAIPLFSAAGCYPNGITDGGNCEIQ